jgi:hypothetical protein
VGTPATTADEILEAAMAYWGLDGMEWTLDWGGGEFVVSDKMQVELKSTNVSEEVEVLMVMGLKERAVRVHSEANSEEVQARAREAFGLQGEEKCEIQRERAGPHAPRERIEITETKKRKGRAQRGATRASRITVHWRGQPHQVDLPRARINQADFERELRAQVPGMAGARYEIPFEPGQNYWAQGKEVAVRELNEGE